MSSKSASSHDVHHKGHQFSQIPNLGDGGVKPPSRSMTFDSSAKMESIDTNQKQNLMPPHPLPYIIRKGSITSTEPPQAGEPRRSPTVVIDDEHRLPTNHEHRRINRSRRPRNPSSSERRRSPIRTDGPRLPSIKGKHDGNPLSRQDSLTEEAFLEMEDAKRETLKEEREHKKQAQEASSRFKGRPSPSEMVSSRGKRDLNPSSPRDSFVEELSYEIEDLRRRYLKVIKENDRLSLMVSELDSDNEHIQDLLDEQESQIRIMQEQSFHQIESHRGFFRAEDDETVRRKIQNCMRSLRSWSTNYALPHRRNIQQTDGDMTGELFRSNVTARRFMTADEIFSPQYNAVAPGIILNTLLAKFVTAWIVQRPFFGLGGGSTGRDDSSHEAAQVSQAFHSVYQRAQLHGDASVAHAWRSQTLRMVDPHEQDLGVKAGYRQESAERRDSYYHDMARIFDSGKVRVFYRPSDDYQRRTELYEIIRALGELFTSLWKQRAHIVCWGLDHFQNEPFTATSDLMTAHPAYRLDEADSALNGHPVQMVVQPAIVAYGNEEGKHYDHYKVWAKAVVWCGPLNEGAS